MKITWICYAVFKSLKVVSNMHKYLPLLDHITMMATTPLEEQDLIGNAIRYDELSPNWWHELNNIDFRNRPIDWESRHTYRIQFPDEKRKTVSYAPHVLGKYTYNNKINLVKGILAHALKHNKKLDYWDIHLKGFTESLPKGQDYHPIHLFLAMKEKELVGVSLMSDWYWNEEEETGFPRHQIILRGGYDTSKK